MTTLTHTITAAAPAPVRVWPLVDIELSARLERTEGRANAAFVEARARLQPESGATWTEIAGTYAMFDGAGSMLTQTFGLGMSGPVSDGDFARIEAFFTERGAEVFHEVSPLAGPEILERLNARGYRPVELSSILYRPTALPQDGTELPAGVRVRRVGADEVEAWAGVSAEGWSSEGEQIAEFVRGFGMISARAAGTECFLAEVDGRPAAAGVLILGDGAALLAGASTIPSFRRRGAQHALLQARLRFAADAGFPVAMMGALPGGASQRNAEREGFRIAYTRIKWHLQGSAA
ncbi:MAG TPA: hypothetical protein VF665_06685 [Longimicrobium sp.]|uniref:hypothetical protein n=1 Tax=Longimicrobium sp. TaxID=2029185 RepID=UPI002EDAE18F